MTHTVVWFDIPVLDLDRACSFYGAVLKCEIRREMDTVAVFPHGNGDVSGCLFLSDKDKPSENGALRYYNVDGRIQEAIVPATQNGGELLQALHSIGPHGFRAILRDPEGNRVCLHSESDS
jgi:predicted enzyme related to lactoylglutathione lyase